MGSMGSVGSMSGRGEGAEEGKLRRARPGIQFWGLWEAVWRGNAHLSAAVPAGRYRLATEAKNEVILLNVVVRDRRTTPIDFDKDGAHGRRGPGQDRRRRDLN